MRSPDTVLIIPAAGAGTRLQSTDAESSVAGQRQADDRSSVRSLQARVQRVVLVVHPSFEVRRQDGTSNTSRLLSTCNMRTQAEPTGMLDAILLASDAARAERRLGVSGLRGAIRSACIRDTIATLGRLSRDSADAAAILPTSRQAPPYIHLDRDAEGRITAIRQRREGDDDAVDRRKRYGAVLAVAGRVLQPAAAVRPRGRRRRPPHARGIFCRSCRGSFSRGHSVLTFPSTNEMEAIGINTPDDRRRLEAYLRELEQRVKRLSIVIPAYNEERFIGTLLERIGAVDLTPHGLEKEIIVVDDCSKDGTAGVVGRFPDVILCRHERNSGKGRAVRTGIERATGDYLMIQDADLEYEPQDYVPMVKALLVEAGGCGVRKPIHERAVRQQIPTAVVAGLSRWKKLEHRRRSCAPVAISRTRSLR